MDGIEVTGMSKGQVRCFIDKGGEEGRVLFRRAVAAEEELQLY